MFFKIQHILLRLIDKLYTLIIKKKFYKFGNNSLISFPCKISSPENIFIGNNVIIGRNVWLNAGNKKNNKATLKIDDGCYISSYTHINAFKDVTVEKNVLVGEGVYFGDTIHSTEDYKVPIIKQNYKFVGKVVIGEGSHLLRYSTISSNCLIGKNCVICPNSFVVHREIPDYSMLIGNPASLIEDYNKKNV